MGIAGDRSVDGPGVPALDCAKPEGALAWLLPFPSCTFQ